MFEVIVVDENKTLDEALAEIWREPMLLDVVCPSCCFWYEEDETTECSTCPNCGLVHRI